MLPNRKKKNGVINAGDKANRNEEEEIDQLKKEIELEQKNKDSADWSNEELERSVRAMERNVLALESGNLEADDSEIKTKYDNQRQLNVQLQEQKRWLEHELEQVGFRGQIALLDDIIAVFLFQIKLKIQNEKMQAMPDPFSLDWDNLSETELKRLVGQLEKTRNDLQSDLREMQRRLEKEGREFHHYDDFCRLYRAEILNLNRTLDALARNGVLPSSFMYGQLSQSGSLNSSLSSTGSHTPGIGMFGGSPKKTLNSMSPPTSRKRDPMSPTKSPTKPRPKFLDPNARIDPKLGPRRNPANIRNLPKIERKAEKKSEKKLRQERETIKALKDDSDLMNKRSVVNGVKELDTVAESPGENQEE